MSSFFNRQKGPPKIIEDPSSSSDEEQERIQSKKFNEAFSEKALKTSMKIDSDNNQKKKPLKKSEVDVSEVTSFPSEKETEQVAFVGYSKAKKSEQNLNTEVKATTTTKVNGIIKKPKNLANVSETESMKKEEKKNKKVHFEESENDSHEEASSESQEDDEEKQSHDQEDENDHQSEDEEDEEQKVDEKSEVSESEESTETKKKSKKLPFPGESKYFYVLVNGKFSVIVTRVIEKSGVPTVSKDSGVVYVYFQSLAQNLNVETLTKASRSWSPVTFEIETEKKKQRRIMVPMTKDTLDKIKTYASKNAGNKEFVSFLFNFANPKFSYETKDTHWKTAKKSDFEKFMTPRKRAEHDSNNPKTHVKPALDLPHPKQETLVVLNNKKAKVEIEDKPKPRHKGYDLKSQTNKDLLQSIQNSCNYLRINCDFMDEGNIDDFIERNIVDQVEKFKRKN